MNKKQTHGYTIRLQYQRGCFTYSNDLDKRPTAGCVLAEANAFAETIRAYYGNPPVESIEIEIDGEEEDDE